MVGNCLEKVFSIQKKKLNHRASIKKFSNSFQTNCIKNKRFTKKKLLKMLFMQNVNGETNGKEFDE